MPCRGIAAVLVLLCGTLSTAWAQDMSLGERIYRAQCAECHGGSGEGTAETYPEPLLGDASVVELARIIEATMPEEEPEKCVGEDAKAVAAYIHEAFYGPLAQIRNRPPRVELSRLTVRQFRESVADLIGSYRGGPERTEQHGLKAEYYDSDRFRKDDRIQERVDEVVDFDFGEGSPQFEDVKVNAEQYAIRWTGSILAPETGEYEFIIRTKNGVQLWVNDNREPLIDGRVRSGEDVELRERLDLLGGRRYELRLEFFKSQKAKEKQGAISFWWKIPHRSEELIPSRNLLPAWSPEVYVVSSPFPPDDRSVGYERGTAISPEWDEATTDAALAAANYVQSRLWELARTKSDAGDRDKKIREFCKSFVERAFHRPLADDEYARYVEQHFDATEDNEEAVKRVVLLALKSPRFLYRELTGAPNGPWNVASRISFALWDSLPDQELRKAVEEKRLQTDDQIRAQIARMVRDPRATAKLHAFLLQWLRVDHLTDIAKDSSAYPDFTPEVISDLRTSMDLFLDEVLHSEQAGLNTLLLDEQLWLNGRLATYYGADLPEDAPFQKVTLAGQGRAGALSHPLLMAGFAYSATSSPIHRGVFLSRSVLGRALKTPPIAVSPTPPDLQPDLTTRERVKIQTTPGACRTCHNLINPLGFSLENFDAVGRYRTEERARPIDASGHYLNRAGEEVEFNGSRALATFLAASPETHEAFVRQLFENMVKQPLPAYGLKTQARLTEVFQDSDLNIRRLASEIAFTVSRTDESLETVNLQTDQRR